MNTEILGKAGIIVLLLVLGFVGGYEFTSPATSGKMRSSNNFSQETVTRRAKPWNKVITTITTHEESHFSEKDLRALKGWLARKPGAQEIEEKFRELKKYSYRKGDNNLYLAMQYLFSYWGKSDPSKSFEKVMSLDGSWNMIKEDLVYTALASQIENNPLEVATWYLDSGNGLFVYRDILPELSLSLTKKSPDEAWEWLSSLPFVEQNKALGSFFEELYHTHPDRMREFIRQLESPERWGTSLSWEEREKIRKVVKYYAKADFEAAKEWVSSFPEEWIGDGYGQLVGARAENDPLEATKLLASIPKSARSAALNALADVVISTNDYDKINAWLETLAKAEDLGMNPASYGGLVNQIDPSRVVSMLNNLPEGTMKDSMICSYVFDDSNPNYDEMKRLLQQVRDQEMREYTMEKLEKNKARKQENGF